MIATTTPTAATPTAPQGGALTNRLWNNRTAQARYLDSASFSRRLLTDRLWENRAARARLLRNRCFKPTTAVHQSAWELAA